MTCLNSLLLPFYSESQYWIEPKKTSSRSLIGRFYTFYWKLTWEVRKQNWKQIRFWVRSNVAFLADTVCWVDVHVHKTKIMSNRFYESFSKVSSLKVSYEGNFQPNIFEDSSSDLPNLSLERNMCKRSHFWSRIPANFFYLWSGFLVFLNLRWSHYWLRLICLTKRKKRRWS